MFAYLPWLGLLAVAAVPGVIALARRFRTAQPVPAPLLRDALDRRISMDTYFVHARTVCTGRPRHRRGTRFGPVAPRLRQHERTDHLSTAVMPAVVPAQRGRVMAGGAA